MEIYIFNWSADDKYPLVGKTVYLLNICCIRMCLIYKHSIQIKFSFYFFILRLLQSK